MRKRRRRKGGGGGGGGRVVLVESPTLRAERRRKVEWEATDHEETCTYRHGSP